MGCDVLRQGGFLRRCQLARPVAARRAGADCPGAAAPDQRLVDVRHTHPKHAGRRPRRHAAIDRRQNPRPKILRIALTLPPSHRLPQHLVVLEANHTFPRSGIPFSDSTQPGYALVCSLIGLEQFTQAFRRAVELFSFSTCQLQRAREERDKARAASGSYDYGSWKQKSEQLTGWQHIAARDGALQVYQMGIVMGKIRSELNNAPTIQRLVDPSALRTAAKCLQRSFPNYRLKAYGFVSGEINIW